MRSNGGRSVSRRGLVLLGVALSIRKVLARLELPFSLRLAVEEQRWLRDLGLCLLQPRHLDKVRPDRSLSAYAGLLLVRSSSSARIGTPRLQACTPWTTQSFSTSMISSIVAPSFNAALMWRRVPGAYMCV
jgi:hypothetical protein